MRYAELANTITLQLQRKDPPGVFEKLVEALAAAKRGGDIPGHTVTGPYKTRYRRKTRLVLVFNGGKEAAEGLEWVQAWLEQYLRRHKAR